MSASPRAGGRPELNLVQTLWHHRADYWGNHFFCWEHHGEDLNDFQLRKQEGKKGREKRTLNNNCFLPQGSGREVGCISEMPSVCTSCNPWGRD